MSYHDDASDVILGSVQGQTLTSEELIFLRENCVLGITLFARNINTYHPFHVLQAYFDAYSPSCNAGSRPCWLVAIDQESGSVARFRDPEIPDLGHVFEFKT